jgi:F0F1-type ATP synthase delta subunit
MLQTVTIITAQSLTAEQLSTATRLLEQRIGKVKIEQKVDTSAIGGIHIRIGAQEFDATISGKLQKIESLINVPIVTTAIALTTAQKKQLEDSFKNSLGSEKFEAKVDQSIIGGVKITIGSKEYDATLQQKLEHIKQHMLQKL